MLDLLGLSMFLMEKEKPGDPPGSLLPIRYYFVDCPGINQSALLQDDLSVSIKDHDSRDEFDAIFGCRFAPDLAQEVDPHHRCLSSYVLL